MKAVPAFVIRPGPGPLAVGVDQGGVEIQDQRAVRGHRRQSGRPGPRSGLGPGDPDGSEPTRIDRIDDPRSRGRRRNGTKEARLVPQHAQVRQTVAAIGQGERHVEQNTARIMASAPLHRRSESLTQGTGQTGEVRHLGQQPGAGM